MRIGGRPSAGGGYGGFGGGGVRFGPSGPVPRAVRALLAINVAVYVFQILTDDWLLRSFALVPALVAELELWRLFTYQFLHGSVMHMALNCLVLWMFGSELEQRWGSRFFVKYYFLCGIAGGIAFTLVRVSALVPTVGASGAIYGILMAYAMWFPRREVLLFLLFPIQVRYLVAGIMGIEFLQALESSGDGVAHAAHLGGAVFGYLYLRSWGASGLTALPSWSDMKRRYYRWRFRRLQKRRMGGGPTIH